MGSPCRKSSGISSEQQQRHRHLRGNLSQSLCEQCEQVGHPRGAGKRFMATPDVNRAVVDTNVLLAATDEARPDHEAAQRVLNDWSASGVVLYSTGQVLREYLAVATRPASANGLGLPRQDAIANVRALRSRM